MSKNRAIPTRHRISGCSTPRLRDYPGADDDYALEIDDESSPISIASQQSWRQIVPGRAIAAAAAAAPAKVSSVPIGTEMALPELKAASALNVPPSSHN